MPKETAQQRVFNALCNTFKDVEMIAENRVKASVPVLYDTQVTAIRETCKRNNYTYFFIGESERVKAIMLPL